jgi:hypothetical protein
VLGADSSHDSQIPFNRRHVRVSATTAVSAVSPVAPARIRVAESSRAAAWLPWLAAILTLVAAMHAIEPLPVGVFYDDAQYLVLAKSLATGNGYRFLNLPGSPMATHFPPGYPAFLALLWRVAPSFPENVALFKFANAFLIAAVAWLVCELARRVLGIPRPLAAVAAVAGTATIPSLVLSSAIMSEPLFLALLFPVLLWAERATKEAGARPVRTAVLLGLAVGVLALVRTHGIALAPAIALSYAARRRWRECCLSVAATILVLAPWFVWVGLHNEALPPLVRGAYGSYTAWLLEGWRADGVHLLAVTLPDNVATFWIAIVRSIVPAIHPAVDVLVGGIYLVLATIGLVRCWRSARVTTLFLAGYLGIVLVWPFSPLRFLWAIWPLLMVLPAAGIVSSWESDVVRRSRHGRRGLVAAALLLAGGIVAFNARGYANAWWSSNARFHARRVLPELAWVARATQPTDVVATDAEAAVYLYTGRRAVPITTFTAAEYARERTVSEETSVVAGLLDGYRPRYVLATSPHVIDALSRLARHRPTLVRVDSVGNGVVYRSGVCTALAISSTPHPCE